MMIRGLYEFRRVALATSLGMLFCSWAAAQSVPSQQRTVTPRAADSSGQRNVYEPVHREPFRTLVPPALAAQPRQRVIPGPGGLMQIGYAEDAAGSEAPLATTPAAQELRLAEASLERFDLRGGAQPGEHPLAPAVRWAHYGLKQMDNIHDYSCQMVKRERINGKLGDMQQMFVKIRHEPFSVYMYFLSPPSVKGQEAMYIHGANDGNMLAHANGVRHRLFGTVKLKPDSMLAMSGNKYPITEVGVKRLVEQLVEIGEADMQYGECDTQFIDGAKIDGRPCTLIQVVHPVPRRNFRFHLARIYVDDEFQLPIRYEAYEWPEQPGGEPVLTEEYTYRHIKINQGFTDADFDVANPNYSFK